MLISARAVRLLLEASERTGVDVGQLMSALELDRARFQDNDNSVPWSLFVRLTGEVSAAVNGDPAHLQRIGRTMVDTPAFGPIRRLAGTVVSAEALHDITARWFGRANFPHLRLLQRAEGNRMLIHGYIPSSYEGSESFMQVSAGTMAALSTLLGLPPSEILESRIDERAIDIELLLPRSPSLVQRGRRFVRAVARRKQRAAILEHEREVLDAGLLASVRAHDELRTVLERLPALVVIHVDGRIVFANRSLARILGWENPNELLGRMLVDSVDARSRTAFLERSKRPALAHPSNEPIEAWLVTKTGDPVAVETSAAQAIVFEGAAARLIVGRDLLERDRLQKQLATADRLAALGLLAAGVAHEVNNPLAYLLNNIEIAQKQLAQLGTAGDVARTALQIATEGAHRIRFIVRELLLLAREEPTMGSATDLSEAVKSTLALARVEIEKTSRVLTEIENVPLVRGSVPRVAQIVLNLVLNSLEAMRSRDPAQNQLTVRIVRADEQNVALEISDNGVGVEGADASRIFMPFFTTKPEGRGTGLGLTVTQRLVTELGGEISFTSERGVGTTFRVLFPMYEEERAASPFSSTSLPT